MDDSYEWRPTLIRVLCGAHHLIEEMSINSRRARIILVGCEKKVSRD